MSNLETIQGSPPHVETHGTDCLLIADFAGGNYQKLTGFPGWTKWKDGTRHLIFRPTPNNIRHLNLHWPDAVWGSAARYHLDRFISEQIEAAATAHNKQLILEDDGSYQYKHKPFDHQRQAFLLSRDKSIFAYFMEQGTGKTKLDLDVSCYNYAQGKIEALIIIAPNGVHSNWIDVEIPEHMPDWCPHKCWKYDSNLTKYRKDELEKVIAAEGVLKIFAFNMEAFTSEKAKGILQRLILTFKCKVTVDESDGLKNPTSLRTAYLTKACDGVAMKRILTGTEITKGVEDIYAQLNFLGTDILGFDTITTFKNAYCTMGGYKCKEVVGYKNMDQLIDVINPYSFRALKKDCMDLPDKIYKRWVVELSPLQCKMYDDLKKNYITEFEGKQITATLGVTRLLRLQQITCGWFPADGEEVHERIPGDNPKLEATLQHCRLTQGKIIVWARFKADVKDITEELRREHGKDMAAAYFGETSDEDRGKIVKSFQEGDLKYIVANKAMSRGRTLTACFNPIIHSNSFDYGDRKQLEDRTHRHGTIENVTYTDVEAKKTVDRKIINCLKKKQNIADLIRECPETVFMDEE